MPRVKQYASDADRIAAFRERKRAEVREADRVYREQQAHKQQLRKECRQKVAQEIRMHLQHKTYVMHPDSVHASANHEDVETCNQWLLNLAEQLEGSYY